MDADRYADEHADPRGLVMAADGHLPASCARPIIEAAMGAECAGHRLEQIARGIRIRRQVAELAGVAGLREVAVEQTRRDPIRDDRLHGWKSDPNLTTWVECAEIDRARRPVITTIFRIGQIPTLMTYAIPTYM